MVSFGLYNIEGNPNLTFIFFIALTILTVIGLRFAYYAYRNRTATSIGTQVPIWNHLLYAGALTTVFGVAGILEIVSSLQFPYKRVALLGATLWFAFAIRQIHATATSADGGGSRARPLERVARVAFVVVVVVLAALLVQSGQSTLTAAVESISAIAFLGYGVVFYQGQVSNTRLQGTMLDSLLRHLLPVLMFAALTSIVNLAIPFGLDRIVVLHVEVVFIIMTATALMTGTIKLRQNLASL
ncbi:hypothetical protein [Salinibaculum rarum]|uniref:hypothetical protein n=1 Tax=Salinibaculum rarum TaxID=3058903 RepID=UPI00265FB4E8|nr:hypothetical protein [Salinibaculum sp. KK48]